MPFLFVTAVSHVEPTPIFAFVPCPWRPFPAGLPTDDRRIVSQGHAGGVAWLVHAHCLAAVAALKSFQQLRGVLVHSPV